jgi:thiol-disulfide isomerase/thioredoxin
MRDLHAREWIAGAALAALALLLYGRHHHPHVLRTGDRLIALPVESLGGSNATLAPSGKPQIINVFATWCPPCRAEMPAFAALANRLQSRGVQVVGVDQQEDATRVALFAQHFDLTYPLYIDRRNVTHDVLGARMIPTTIFVDAKGIIRWERSGPLGAGDFRSLAAAMESAG